MDGHSGSIREVGPIPDATLNVSVRNKSPKSVLYTELTIRDFQNCPFLVIDVMLFCQLVGKLQRYLLPRSLG